MKKLSKAEMKQIAGGRVYWACSCIGSVGTWVYSGMPTTAQRGQDISTYCRSGSGACALVRTLS